MSDPRPEVRKLDPRVISKIAAGEMILRPLSVAKELLENSVDARSRRIVVEVGERPDALLQVTDDGIGMTEADLRLALETHATSKLRSEEDLLRVGSLGFRGEAVPSIGRVSRMTIETASDESGAGFRARVEGGTLRAIEPTSRRRGTTVRAEDLFFNSPVRKRFLKTAAGERRAIRKMVETYAYAYPDLHLRLVEGGVEKLDLAPADGLAERMSQLGGAGQLEQLLAVEDAAPRFRVHGFVGVPELARGGTQHQTLLVNRRWVTAPWLSAALRQAFGDLLPPGKNPLAVLLLDIDPSRIDVNVHPTKREIRFLDESEIFGWLVRVVKAQVQTLVPTWNLEPGNRGGGWSRAGRDSASKIREVAPLIDELYRGPTVRTSDALTPGDFDGRGEHGEHGDRGDRGEHGDRGDLGIHTSPGERSDSNTQAPEWVRNDPSLETQLPWERSDADVASHPVDPDVAIDPADSANPANPPNLPNPADPGDPEASASDARVLWQLHRRYILAQTQHGALIIDQHAAHERILYEQTLKRFRTGGFPVQQLLAPLTLTLEPDEMECFRRFSGEFAAVGLDATEFGNDTVLLRGAPTFWSKDPEATFRDVLADLGSGIGRRFARREEQLAASFACRSAIKSGRPLSQREMQRLVHDLFATDVPHGDPHGRPTFFEVDLNDFDRRFGRH